MLSGIVLMLLVCVSWLLYSLMLHCLACLDHEGAYLFGMLVYYNTINLHTVFVCYSMYQEALTSLNF